MSALVFGIAGVAPRSVIPNLAELLSKLISARSELCRLWMTEVLFSVRRASRSASQLLIPLARSLTLRTARQTRMRASGSSRR